MTTKQSKETTMNAETLATEMGCTVELAAFCLTAKSGNVVKAKALVRLKMRRAASRSIQSVLSALSDDEARVVLSVLAEREEDESNDDEEAAAEGRRPTGRGAILRRVVERCQVALLGCCNDCGQPLSSVGCGCERRA